MKQVLFIHGGSAYSDYRVFLQHLRTSTPRYPNSERPARWSDSLRTQLGEAYEVFTPAMPNKENAQYEEWKIWFEQHFEFLHDEAMLIGWSQGGYFLTKYLIENATPFSIKALFLVAAPFEPDGFDGEDGGDFNFDTSRAGELANKAEKIVIMHSEDDFVVPYQHALKYKSALPQAELMTFTDRNHFLQAEFPELIGELRLLQ